MFKFLLIIGLVLYVVYKVGSLFFRAGAASQQFRNQRQQPRNFDANQNGAANQNAKAKGSNVKGGEYIDYEEVK
jgi:hypothetical protein